MLFKGFSFVNHIIVIISLRDNVSELFILLFQFLNSIQLCLNYEFLYSLILYLLSLNNEHLQFLYCQVIIFYCLLVIYYQLAFIIVLSVNIIIIIWVKVSTSFISELLFNVYFDYSFLRIVAHWRCPQMSCLRCHVQWITTLSGWSPSLVLWLVIVKLVLYSFISECI